MQPVSAYTRSPTARLVIAVAVATALVVPLIAVWVLISGREKQSDIAASSIAEGWGGPQVVAGPMLVIPYRTSAPSAAFAAPDTWELRTLAPELVELNTDLRPERRARSIYEAIVYKADLQGSARFVMPADLARQGLDPARFDLARAELRFTVSEPQGLVANPTVSVNGAALRLQPGHGSSQAGQGFFAWLDAASLGSGALDVRFALSLRGNRSLALVPKGGDTRWTVTSSWAHPSFQGRFLPAEREIGSDGFRARYQVGNLALGQSLITPGAASPLAGPAAQQSEPAANLAVAQIDLVEPVDLYAQVERAAKYGFLFIGFTFLALLLFDVVGGVRVHAAEYLLVGVGLVLFFVLLLAFAEVIGFAPAYLLASAAITGLITFYSASVLKSWRRAFAVAALMSALYAMLYLLLSLEAYSLLIGALLLFVTLAGVMYLTRNLNWGGREEDEAAVGETA